MLLIGYGLDRRLRTSEGPRTEDYAFWCYLFGMFAFWGGLTFMNSSSEIKRLVYAIINCGLIGLAVKLKRTTFLVFGALGVHLYSGPSSLFCFQKLLLLSFRAGAARLSLILITVLMQRRMNRMIGKRMMGKTA
ncbi:MAG: hypothetical protein WKF84_24805 [Pyrinomonadaceae bacterium]